MLIDVVTSCCSCSSCLTIGKFVKDVCFFCLKLVDFFDVVDGSLRHCLLLLLILCAMIYVHLTQLDLCAASSEQRAMRCTMLLSFFVSDLCI